MKTNYFIKRYRICTPKIISTMNNNLLNYLLIRHLARWYSAYMTYNKWVMRLFQVLTLSHRIILFCLLNTFYQQFLYSMSFVYLLSSLFFKEGILFLFMREKREATTFFTIHIFLQIVFIIIFTLIIFIFSLYTLYSYI